MRIVNILEDQVHGFHQILTGVSDSNPSTQGSRITSLVPQLPRMECQVPCKAVCAISCDQCLPSHTQGGGWLSRLDLD